MNSFEHPTSAPHTIRLASQWDWHHLPDVPSNQQATPLESRRLKRISEADTTMPASLPARIRFERRFGRPSGLTTDDRVDLVVELGNLPVTMTLNGRSLTARPTAGRVPSGQRLTLQRFDLTKLLAERNLLALDFVIPAAPAIIETVRNAWLEIHGGEG